MIDWKFPILFIIALIFWWALSKGITKMLDKFEENNADHQ